MKLIKSLSYLALALTIVPPILTASGLLSDVMMKIIMPVGAAIWFATAPRWLHGGES